MAINKRRKLNLSRGERFIYTTAAFLCLIFCVFTVFSKATLSKVNIEIERLKDEITEQNKKNESLTMKVNELASLDNINCVAAEMGLSYNNDNIKTIVQ